MRPSRAFPAMAACLLLAAGAARADEIKNKISMFAGLDKITGRIVKFEAAIGETVQFGTLQITPRSCYTKPQTEAPQTVGFVQVDEASADSKVKRIFSGWMFAASPGLNGVEHPVYDVWLLDCKDGYATIPETADATPAAAGAHINPAATPARPAQSIEDLLAAPAGPASAVPPAAAAAPRAPVGKAIRAGAAAPTLAPPIEVGDAPIDQAPARPAATPNAGASKRPVRRRASAPVTLDPNDDARDSGVQADDPPDRQDLLDLPPDGPGRTLRPPGLIPN